MIFKIFAIHDSKAEAFLPPVFLPTDGQAKRTFADACNDSSHDFGKHPEDYCLFLLGTYDDSTGLINRKEAPLSLGLGIEYLSDVSSFEGVN